MTDEANNDTTNETTSETAADSSTSTETPTTTAKVAVSKDQLRNLTDATLADIKRSLAKAGAKLKGGDLAVIERVAANATKLAIDTRTTPEGDEKALKSLTRRKQQLDAQLGNVKAYFAVAAQKKFWAIVEGVVERFFAALIKAI